MTLHYCRVAPHGSVKRYLLQNVRVWSPNQLGAGGSLKGQYAFCIVYTQCMGCGFCSMYTHCMGPGFCSVYAHCMGRGFCSVYVPIVWAVGFLQLCCVVQTGPNKKHELVCANMVSNKKGYLQKCTIINLSTGVLGYFLYDKYNLYTCAVCSLTNVAFIQFH